MIAPAPGLRRIAHVRVAGKATTKGSMRPQQRRVVVDGQSLGVGHARLTEDTANSKQWRAEVAWHVRIAMRGAAMCTGPVRVIVAVYLPQPKSNRDPYPTAKYSGDVDKLARNILDALPDAGAIRDDAQVITLHTEKRWAADRDNPYTVIEVDEYKEDN